MTMSGADDRVAVIGGGMAGMAAAYYLQRAGLRPQIIEAEPALGGRCAVTRLNGREITYGGKNIGKKYRLFREFTAAMGDHPYEYFGINSSRVENGTLRTFDSGRRLRGFLDVIVRAPKRDIMRFGRVVAAVRANEARRYLGSRYAERVTRRGDRVLTDRFGARFADATLRMLTIRPNGAEPDELYLGTLTANVGMVLDSYDQLTNGFGPVIESFAASHDVRLQTRAVALLTDGGRVTGVRTQADGQPPEDQHYSAVVIATPAFAAATLLRAHRPRLADHLERVRYFAGAVVVAHYARDIFTEQVRALVFDKNEPVSNAGVYGVDDRDLVRYTFSGRMARQLLEGGADGAALLGQAEERLARYIPVNATDRLGFVSRSWGHGYCAHLADHPAFLRTIDDEVAALPGLALAGDYLRGVSIEACFRSGHDAAARLEPPGTVLPGKKKKRRMLRRQHD
jgi:oxygen-dependent protoporphyrinogen oxidase